MKQFVERIDTKTEGQGLYEITETISKWLSKKPISEGLLTVYVEHTSASLLIQENADPSVLRDLNSFYKKIAPEGENFYEHSSEGSDDMPAHIRASLMQTHLSIPVVEGKIGLGTWQGIYLCEHRNYGGYRKLVLTAWGETY